MWLKMTVHLRNKHVLGFKTMLHTHHFCQIDIEHRVSTRSVNTGTLTSYAKDLIVGLVKLLSGCHANTNKPVVKRGVKR